MIGTTTVARDLACHRPRLGAVHDTIASPSPATALAIVGATGTDSGTTTVFDATDGLLVPIPFVAVTRHV